MIEEIKRRLEAGEVVELECVDKEGYKRENPDERWSVLNLDKIIVTSAQLVAVSIKNANVAIMRYELKYFRIKQAPTFDDLIDVAVQAYKNRLLDIFLMNDEVITVFNHDATGTKEGINKADTSKYYQFIDFINSLYTETFVIESVEDTLKIDTSGSEIIKVILANNEVLSSNYLDCLCDISDGFRFKILKGATVTQKRGK